MSKKHKTKSKVNMEDQSSPRQFALNTIRYLANSIWQLPPYKRITLLTLSVAAVLVMAFALARAGFLDARSREIAISIWPSKIPYLDSDRVDILVSFDFEVESGGVRKVGRLGGVYHTGDIIHLAVGTNVNCWLLVFCVDSKGIHTVYRERLQTGFFAGGEQKLTKSFALDQTVGPEIYYAIASYQKFDFERDIRPHLVKVERNIQSKGPDPLPPQLDLPERFFQAAVFFLHQ